MFTGLALSPDGTRLAAVRDGPTGGNTDIWIYDTARGIPTRFTFSPRADVSPAWFPDGSTIYYISGNPGKLFRKAANGIATEEIVPTGEGQAASFPNVSPDGKWLLCSTLPIGGGAGDIWVLPLDAAAPQGNKVGPRALVHTPANQRLPMFSPDGRWVTYASDESRQYEIYATPFPGPGAKRQLSSGGGRNHAWRRDGKELFYQSPTGQLKAVEIVARNGTLDIGSTHTLFEGLAAGITSVFAVTSDGQKFIVAENTTAEAARPLTIVQNWTAALKK